MPASTILRTIEPGADVLEALADIGRAGEGWVNATGELDSVELRVAGEGADPVRVLRGRLTLLQLAGPSAGPFSVTLARASDVGIEVLGGVLVRARSGGVSAVVYTTDTAALPARAPAPRTGAAAPAAAAAPTAADTGGTVWAAAAMASARARARDAAEAEEEILPEAGDLVDHFAFGKCEVLTSDGDRLRIRDIDGPQRIREVSLSMLKVMPPTESDGKRLYRLVRKGSVG
jgi:hypothetical protein